MDNTSVDSDFIIYAYTMVWDTGFAPAVKDGVLSLACCKTYLRYKVASEFKSGKEIYIVGICGNQLAQRNSRKLENKTGYFPVYIAKVSDAPPTTDYYSSECYSNRPDRQYEYKGGEWFYKKDNPHHYDKNSKEKTIKLEDHEKEKDLYYIRKGQTKLNYVLLSNEYLYLGINGKDIDTDEFRKICEERRHAWRGDLRPITLSSEEKVKLITFFTEKRSLYQEQKVHTIDDYFLNKPCKGEGGCR